MVSGAPGVGDALNLSLFLEKGAGRGERGKGERRERGREKREKEDRKRERRREKKRRENLKPGLR